MKYIGVTIGPIYKTLKQAKKTRELWAASYMFSYILREIANKFDRDFILPKKDNSIKEIGVFNDRFIFESKNGDIEELPKKIDEVLREFSKNNNIDYRFLKEYLQIHYVEVEVEDLEKENIVEKVYKYLDSKELFFTTTQKDDLKRFFKNIAKSKMMEFAFGKDKKFPTLLEISMVDLIENDRFNKEELKYIRGFEDRDELDLEGVFRNKKIPNFYKYVAIVKADGDNMGKVNKLLKTKGDYKKLSNDLFEFVKEANEKIKDFKGKVILGSGDDLLFIAPVVYKNKNKNIFELIFEIKSCYKEKMKSWNEKLKDKTSLSVGVSITYYKYPLFEAFEIANNELFNRAKRLKDSIAFNVIKHSGQSFFGVIPASLEEKVKDLFNKEFKFFSSVIYKLDENKFLLDYLGNNKKDFYHFFKNNFNENFDEEMFSKISEFLKVIYEDENVNKLYKKEENETKIFLLYSILRFLHFIKEKNEKVS